jgi:IS30 family transposase
MKLTTEEQHQIAIMAAEGFTAHTIGKRLQRDAKTVRAALRKPETAVLVEDKKAELADAYEQLARRFLSSITDEDVTKINAYQRMVAAGIATDKMRLLRDQSTSNVSLLSRLIDEAPDLPE